MGTEFTSLRHSMIGNKFGHETGVPSYEFDVSRANDLRRVSIHVF